MVDLAIHLFRGITIQIYKNLLNGVRCRHFQKNYRDFCSSLQYSSKLGFALTFRKKSTAYFDRLSTGRGNNQIVK